MKFRKKPVVIDAIQFRGNTNDILLFVGHYLVDKDGVITIETLEGEMKVSHGDWIIKGVKGEFYPCKHEIFQGTYEAVEK